MSTAIARRHFIGTAAMTLAAAKVGIVWPAAAQSRKAAPAGPPTLKPRTHLSFGARKQIDAGLLAVGA
jgi:hypothetical protein